MAETRELGDPSGRTWIPAHGPTHFMIAADLPLRFTGTNVEDGLPKNGAGPRRSRWDRKLLCGLDN